MTESDRSTNEPSTRIMALVFTGVAGSRDLETRVGAAEYERIIQRQDAIFRAIVDAGGAGEVIQDLGDGLVVRFTSTRDAIESALRFQRQVAREPWEHESVRVCIGVHAGEMTETTDGGDERPQSVALASTIAARLMQLARPGQILMSRVGFDAGRQYVREYPIGDDDEVPVELQWMAHGPYMFGGYDDAVEVFEVGGVGIAPLEAPDDTSAARRAVPAGEEEMYGWRPAVGLFIPRRANWRLDRRLGEGGFGEVWLAVHQKTGSRRVFKFCFDAERARSFKRELTLFRLLRSVLGERADIARLHDIEFDRPPFFLESEFTEDGDLKEWAIAQGGIDRVPLRTRIEIVTLACDAVAAAHSVGILHKDIKPSNILIYRGEDGGPRPQLADFGIGEITDRTRLERADITMSGFTETLTTGGDTSRTGTRLYAPPESLVGKAFTVQGDVYALGVILYQLVVGDLTRPLGQGWEREVEDPLLREDIASCVAGRPEDRLPSAAHLAERLRSLDRRARAQRRRRGARIATFASVILVLLLIGAGGLVVRERIQGNKIAVQRDLAREAQREAERQEAAARATSEFLEDMLTAADPWSNTPDLPATRQIQVIDVLDAAAVNIEERFENQPLAEARVRVTLAGTYMGLGDQESAALHAEAALRLRTAELGRGHPDTLAARRLTALAREYRGLPAEAEPLFNETLEARRRTLGETHPDTLESMHDLARFLMDMGRYDEAEPLTLLTLRQREETLGPDDEATLDTREALAGLYLRTGRYDEAEPLYERALETRSRLHGPSHASTLTTTSALAEVYVYQGRNLDAEPLITRVAEVSTEILGEEHPVALGAAARLAALCRNLGRIDEAEAIYARTLALQRRVLGVEHPWTQATQNDFANLYSTTGRNEKAEELLSEAVEINRRVLGDEHPDTMMSMSNLALVYEELDRMEEAESLQFEAYTLRRKALGDDNPYTHGSMSLLGNLYFRLDRLDEAEAMHVKAVAGIRKSLSTGHWYCGVLLGNYGRFLFQVARYDEAEAALLEAYEYVHGSFGDDDRRSRGIVRVLIDVYDASDRLDKKAVWEAKLGGQPAAD